MGYGRSFRTGACFWLVIVAFSSALSLCRVLTLVVEVIPMDAMSTLMRVRYSISTDVVLFTVPSISDEMQRVIAVATDGSLIRIALKSVLLLILYGISGNLNLLLVWTIGIVQGAPNCTLAGGYRTSDQGCTSSQKHDHSRTEWTGNTHKDRPADFHAVRLHTRTSTSRCGFYPLPPYYPQRPPMPKR